MFYQWWAIVVRIRRMKISSFVITGDMQGRNLLLVPWVSWGLKSTVDEDILARRVAELAKTREIQLY